MALSVSQKQNAPLVGPLLLQLLKKSHPALQSWVLPLQDDKQPAAGEPHEASQWHLDPTGKFLLLRIDGKPEHLPTLTRAHLIQLQLHYQHQLYQSQPLDITRVQLHADHLLLQAQPPKILTPMFQRAFFRVHLPESLVVRVTLQQGRQACEGRLQDLSCGGCGIRLSLQNSLALCNQTEPLQLTLAFPCGESLQVSAEKINLQPDKRFANAVMGCRFYSVDEADEQRLMRYTLETEREVARLGDHDCQFKPSWLYQTAAANPEQPPIETPTPTAVRQLADQLAVQALLLAGQGSFHPQRLQHTSENLITQLVRNTGQWHLQLAQENGIHPLIRHHLRVAARFFPLGLKLGLKPQHQVALMSSLLIHDLARLLTGLHTCQPLNDVAPALLQTHRSNLLHLLRATAELSWIPRGLTEATIMNANERLDGRGFPRGLPADQQDRLTRGLAVTKQLDWLACCNPAPQHPRWTPAHEAVRQNPAYDASLLEAYIQLHGRYPIGSQILFEKQYVARVTQVNDQGEPAEIQLIVNLRAPEHPLPTRRIGSEQLHLLGAILGEYLPE